MWMLEVVLRNHESGQLFSDVTWHKGAESGQMTRKRKGKERVPILYEEQRRGREDVEISGLGHR